MRKIGVFIIVLTLFVTGCSVTSDIGRTDVKNKDWQLLTESAVGSNVTIYHNIKDEEFAVWIEKSIAPVLKEDYKLDVELKYKPIEEYYEDLKKQFAEGSKGVFDLLIYEDTSGKILHDNNLLYENFTNKMPNVSMMQNKDAYEHMYSEGVETLKQTVLLGRKQLIMIYDEDLFSDAPTTMQQLLEITKTNEGKISYIDPSNEMGRDFINSVFFAFMDYEDIYSMNLSKADLKIKAKDALDFFSKLSPYMAYKDGVLPKNQDEIDEMFYNGSILFSMTYKPDHSSVMSKKELYPFGAKAFVFDSGTTGDAFYGVIPFNSNNKSGAILVLNQMLSPDAQRDKYDTKKWGNLPSVDTSIMEAADSKVINSIAMKRSDIKQEDILLNRIPEVPKKVSDMLYEIWKEEVESKLYGK